jgi:endonuclease-3
VTQIQRAAFIQQRLEQLYPDPPIPLDHTDAFTLLVAVLLSAQCTDVRVNQITPALFALGRIPEKLSKVPVEKIEAIVRPCGLGPQKARAIRQLSEILGVGHKTAQVVMAQSFGVPSFPVDTHIHRLAQRWQLTTGKNVSQTEKDLKRLFPESAWNKLHLQIIFYGREHCTARGCDGTVCEICTTCFPERKRAVKTKKA